MGIDRTDDGAVTILAFSGELDRVNLKELTESIEAVVSSGRVKLVFNLEKLRFIDSTALGCFLRTQTRVTGEGGEIVFSAPSQYARGPFRTLGIDQAFKIYPDDDAAVAHFG